MISGSISNIIMALFGVSSFVFVTDFFYADLPNLTNISPDSLPIAIWSFIGAIITFFLKQSDSIKKMEQHLASLVESTKKLIESNEALNKKTQEKIDLLNKQKEIAEEQNKNQKEIKESLRLAERQIRSGDSQVRRIPQYLDEVVND